MKDRLTLRTDGDDIAESVRIEGAVGCEDAEDDSVCSGIAHCLDAGLQLREVGVVIDKVARARPRHRHTGHT